MRRLKKYSRVFDSLYLNLALTSNDSYLLSLKDKWKNNLNVYINKLFVLDEKLDNYIIIPEGYYYPKNNLTKTNKEIFLISRIALDEYLVDCYHILIYDKIFKSKISSTKLNNETVEWLKLTKLNESDIEFLQCDGWESIKQKNKYSSNNKSDNYKIDIKNTYLKYDFRDIKDDNLQDIIEEKSEEQANLIQANINSEKELAIRNGTVTGIAKLFFLPIFGYDWLSHDRKIKSSKKVYSAEIAEVLTSLTIGAKIGFNIFSDEIEYKHFKGLEISAKYIESINFSITEAKVDNYNVSDHNTDFKKSDHKIKGWELELLYKDKFWFGGIGYGSMTSKYKYKFENNNFFIENVEKFNPISLIVGLCYDWFEIFTKAIFANNLFTWSAGNNNISLGANIIIPINFFTEYPDYH